MFTHWWEDSQQWTDNTILQWGRQGWTVLDVTLDIPEYNGNMKWNKCLDLLSVVERTFYYKGDVWHEGQAITIKLKGQALSWWELNQLNGVKDEHWANDIMGQDEAIDDGALFLRVHLYSNRIPLSADFISTRKRNPTFLSSLTWVIAILSIEENQFIFYLFHYENASHRTTKKGASQKIKIICSQLSKRDKKGQKKLDQRRSRINSLTESAKKACGSNRLALEPCQKSEIYIWWESCNVYIELQSRLTKQIGLSTLQNLELFKYKLKTLLFILTESLLRCQ